jgi:hypothetical protein
MIRERLIGKEPAVQNGFRLRGLGGASRVEALSDGVIAFAITLTRSPRYTALAGMVYWLIGPVLYPPGRALGRRRKRLAQNVAEDGAPALDAPADAV